MYLQRNSITQFFNFGFFLAKIDMPTNDFDFFRLFAEIFIYFGARFTSVIDTDEEFLTVVNDTGKEFLTGVNDTGTAVLYLCQRTPAKNSKTLDSIRYLDPDHS
jgi:hypothetical protein